MAKNEEAVVRVCPGSSGSVWVCLGLSLPGVPERLKNEEAGWAVCPGSSKPARGRPGLLSLSLLRSVAKNA